MNRTCEARAGRRGRTRHLTIAVATRHTIAAWRSSFPPDGSRSSRVPRDPERERRSRARAPTWRAPASGSPTKVRALGGEAELREDGRLVVGEIAGPPGAPTVLVYGHYDVQPPAPLELWESDPFAAEVRGEWLYARGVADDKGQLWMQLKAIEELVSAGPPPVTLPRRVRRRGGDGRRRDHPLPRGRRRAGGRVRRPRRLDEDAATRPSSSSPRVASSRSTSRCGRANATSTPATTAAPRSTRSMRSPQALTALFPRNGRLPEPLRAGVTHPSADEVEGWLELPPGADELARVGAVPLDDRADEDFYERVFVEPSLDVTGILGGKPGLRNTTLVSSASAGITIRVAPGQDPEVLATAAEELLREALPAGARLEITARDLTPPAVLPRDTEVLALAQDAFEGVFGRRPLIVRVGGTLPITAALAARGIPTVMAGLALPTATRTRRTSGCCSRRSRSASPPRARPTARSARAPARRTDPRPCAGTAPARARRGRGRTPGRSRRPAASGRLRARHRCRRDARVAAPRSSTSNARWCVIPRSAPAPGSGCPAPPVACASESRCSSVPPKRNHAPSNAKFDGLRHLLEAERLRVEAARARRDRRRRARRAGCASPRAYRNLAAPTKEARCH